jgi:hypothetical protein
MDDIRKIDRPVVVLDVLLDERNVTQATARLIPQPTISGMLTRLRDASAILFVYTQQGVLPTRAGLAAPLKQCSPTAGASLCARHSGRQGPR